MLCLFINSFSSGKKQKSHVLTTQLITGQLKHWLPSKMPALNYSFTRRIRHSCSYCTENDWLEDQEQSSTTVSERWRNAEPSAFQLQVTVLKSDKIRCAYLVVICVRLRTFWTPLVIFIYHNINRFCEFDKTWRVCCRWEAVSLSLRQLSVALCAFWRADEAHSQAHRSQAVPMCTLCAHVRALRSPCSPRQETSYSLTALYWRRSGHILRRDRTCPTDLPAFLSRNTLHASTVYAGIKNVLNLRFIL